MCLISPGTRSPTAGTPTLPPAQSPNVPTTARVSPIASVLQQPSVSHISHDTGGPPPPKRRRAKRTEDERIAYFRADPFVAKVEPYR
jgi:hypothetical protein